MLIANIVFRGCSLKKENRSIIQVDSCDHNESGGTVQLRHVTFRRNSLDGARGVSIDRSSCSDLEMVNVVFSDNACGDGCFGSLSPKNTLRDVKLKRNIRLSEGDAQQSLMLMPPESSSSVYRLVARENDLSSLRVEKGELRIVESDFEENGDSSIVLDRASRVRVIDCSFRRNTAALSGAAILADATDRVTLANCSFDSNIAESGGSIASMDTDLRIRNCTFRSNVVSNRGGAIIGEKNVIDLQSSVFENNSASVSGGAICLVDVDEASLSGIQCSNNTSGNGGCLQASRSTGLVIQRSVLTNNTVTENGGGVDVVDQRSFIIQEVTWTNNVAGQRGGAVSAESSNVTSQASAYRSNRATSGGGFLIEYGSAESDRDTFVGNVASAGGGGIAALRTSIALRNSLMMQNSGHRGAGVDVLSSDTIIHNVSFAQNAAHTSRGGGLACHTSNMTVTDSQFDSNAAVNTGGAIDANLCPNIIGRNLLIRNNRCSQQGGGIGIIDGTDFTLIDSVLHGNSAGTSGAVHNQNSTIHLIGCSIDSNIARSAGGMVVVRNGEIVIEDSLVTSNHAHSVAGAIYSESKLLARNVTFRNNSAVENGGALYGDGSSTSEISDSFIIDSRSRKGGAILVRGNSSITLDRTLVRNNMATQSGGGVYILDAATTVRNTDFDENRALTGGSVFLEKNSTLHMTASSFKSDVAFLSGGSIAATSNSTVSIVETTFSNCSAAMGGAVWLSNSSLRASRLRMRSTNAIQDGGGIFANVSSTLVCSDCVFRANSAGRYGGAVAFDADRPQSLALHLNACSFVKNEADLGGNPHRSIISLSIPVLGALHIATDREQGGCSQMDVSCTFVAVTGSSFLNNSANTSGGAIFTRDHRVLRYSCSREDDSDALPQLDVLTSVRDMCPEWTGNRAGRYGPTVASYINTVRGLTVDGNDNSKMKLLENNRLVARNHKSGDALPTVLLEPLDGYDQGSPIGTGNEYIQATMHSPDGFFSGGMIMSLDRQRNRFPPISGLQSPGSYRILIDFSEPYLRHFTIDVDVRSCRVGEFSQDNGALCLPCSGSQYNFDPNATECATCPENGDCTTNVILPKRGHWHRTPCSKHIQRCISRKACDFEAREEKLSALTQNLNDCDVDEVLDKEYSQAQCAKVCFHLRSTKIEMDRIRDTKTFSVDLAIQGMEERNTTIAVNVETIQKRRCCLFSLWPFCSFCQGSLSGAICTKDYRSGVMCKT